MRVTRDGPAAGFERAREAFRRRKWLAIFVFLLLTTAATGLITGMPDVYSATATILVEPPQGLEAATPEEVQARLQLITQRIQSRDRLMDIVARNHLYSDILGKVSEVAVLERMRRDIRLELKGPEGGRTVVAFALSYRCPDPTSAANVANALTEMYLAEDARLQGGLVESLSAQLKDVKERLEKQELEVGAFQDRYNGELPQQLEMNLAAAQRLDGQLRVVSEARVRAVERRSALLRQMAEEKAPDPSPNGREAQLESLRRQLAELQRQYTDKYPDIVRLKEQLAALEQQPPSEPVRRAAEESSLAGKSALREAEAEIRSLSDEEQRLHAQVQEYQKRIEVAPRRQQDFQQKERDHETTRSLYNALLKRLQESQLAVGEAGNEAGRRLRLLEQAAPPREPVAPKRIQLALLGVLFALAVSAGLAAVVEKADSSFHSARDLREFTRVPVLAAISIVSGTQETTRRRRLRALLATAGLLSLVLVAQLSQRVARANPDLTTLVTRVH